LVAPVAARALSILSDPDLASIFGPDSRAEVPFSLLVTHGHAPARLEGRIDRLVVTPERVLIVDYKSDSGVPARPDAVPPAYPRQLGLYRLAARLLFPGLPVEAAILWTQIPALMAIPTEMLDGAAADVTVL